MVSTRCCPSSLAKLVQMTPISLWFIGDITIVNGIYPLAMSTELLKMAIDSEFSHEIWWCFHRYVNVYQSILGHDRWSNEESMNMHENVVFGYISLWSLIFWGSWMENGQCMRVVVANTRYYMTILVVDIGDILARCASPRILIWIAIHK